MKTFYNTLSIAALLMLSSIKVLGQASNTTTNYPVVKEEALLILQQNCNQCHKRLNPTKVFTRDNMESFAALIEKEALIKKRMPLGFWNKLEEKELAKLQTWVDQLKKQSK